MTTDLHHLAAAYALDALDADERRSFEQHYPTCDVCNAEVHEYRETAARMAAASATMPSAGMRDRVLDEIKRTRQIAPLVPDRVVDLDEHRRRRTNLSWGSALIGAAAAVVIAFIGAIVFRGGTGDVSDADLVALLAAPDAAVEPLSGTGDGAISVVWSAERDAVAVIGAELSDPGDERTYALWALGEDGTPTPSLLFRPDDSGSAGLVGPLDTDPVGWGVTIEPVGGSPAPTGEILYLTA